ncbi:(5-formylfuran-3-yl)methyl phosphate synthase [Azohydromonas aeria]|uniref:(5-formylfuran-3-yl)methyl phosphate synthase n=1 Tax=Azohydromonas aeria TaxID=2590212 RepID=UPI0012FA4E75|nr:(5-formylfuran-3-yl)methyl phosphate synthase [Azohydromonas aeria]
MTLDTGVGLERGGDGAAPAQPPRAEAVAARLARNAGARGGARLLVSVRDVREALAAAAAGADLIDLKEPDAGALGAVPLHVVHEVVQALRAAGHAQPVSATVGDFPAGAAREALLERVRATAACGVDLVKVGIARGDGTTALLAALAGSPAAVVPVFFADEGLDEALLALACWLRFPALMLDTADKRAGSLPDVLDAVALRHFIGRVRGAGKLAGVAGSLRLAHIPLVRELAPDIAGFRGAACADGRGSALDPQRVATLAAEFR